MTKISEANLANIVLVEDNISDIEYIKFLIKKHNVMCKLQVFRDGQEILDFLYKKGPFTNAEYPDLIILDLNIPKIHGMEILKKIKKDNTLSRLPILILSGSSFEEDVVQCHNHGAISFMHKPFDIKTFLMRIDETVGVMVQTSEKCVHISQVKS